MSDERPVAVSLENRLMSHGIYVTECRRLETDGAQPDDTSESDRPAFYLEYETVADAPVVTSEEVGAVVRTVLAVAEERGWTPGRLEATSLTTDGDHRGRWHVEADWFDQLGIGLSEIEFSERVLETVTTAQDQVN